MSTQALQRALESLPPEFPATWASDWGQDRYGLWMSLVVGDVRQMFRWIPPGRFIMGSPPDEAERGDNETQHEVVLTRGFWLADTACSQALWQAVTGDNPSHFEGAERPVETVSWEAAQEFIVRLNERFEGLRLRLPTEAEWEYACRAGTESPFSFGENIATDQANYDGRYPYAGMKSGEFREATLEVKALPCNGWGLYQMHGNVLEWCVDWYGAYPSEQVEDPTGPKTGEGRVLRGGSWDDSAGSARSARRGRDAPGFGCHGIGFRLARGQ